MQRRLFYQNMDRGTQEGHFTFTCTPVKINEMLERHYHKWLSIVSILENLYMYLYMYLYKYNVCRLYISHVVL